MRCHYGGTFDPIHNGHLAIARAARDQLRADVHLVPAADPPHRAAPGADARQRARMLELAIAGEPGLQLDLRELGREGPSYTVDTLQELRTTLGPRQPLALLLGADSLLSLPQWHQWRRIRQLAHLVVAQREGSRLDQALPAELDEALHDAWCQDLERLRRQPAGLVFRLQQPLQPEAASAVRERIAAGRDWDHLVPASVAAFIRAQALYTER